MKVNPIALVVAVVLGYLGAAMQFFPTHAVPKRLRNFFAGNHDASNSGGSHL